MSLIARGILPSLDEIYKKHFITNEGVIQSSQYGYTPKKLNIKTATKAELRKADIEGKIG